VDPVAEYTARLGERRSTRERLDRVAARVSYARLIVFLAAVVLAAFAATDRAGWWSAAPLAAGFIALVVYHDRVLRRAAGAGRAIAFYDRGLARIDDRWMGSGEEGERFRDDAHLYANDLDLFGRGSLFQLLSTARTRAGEARLAAWLMHPASRDEVRDRQQAISELAPALDLRESLSLAGADVAAAVHDEALVAWAEGRPLLSPALRVVPIVLTIATVASIVRYVAAGDAVPLEISIVVQSLFAWTYRHEVERALHAADGPARDLDVVSHVLEQLERQRFSSPRLASLRGRLDTEGRPASASIRALHRLVAMHDWEHNLAFTPIALVLLWGTHLAWAIEAWRSRHGREIRGWLDAVADVEALASLAAYRYEHPGDPFPELVDANDATFDGRGLGHPLLPSARMVRNDVTLGGDTRVLVVSGSNMSGKSTLLRTVGINAVLALTGAPVRAASLRLSPLAIGATLRIQDSLQEGRSRFYAEITRIRELTDRARLPPPLLFLLDELFHGTNSHDRVVGAAGVLRGLIDRGAIGLITTHDLALTAIADELAPKAANVHFEDWFDGADLQFDYRMKAGPVTRSNAIALMRAVGLDVDRQS
jgi:hypothetical protein